MEIILNNLQTETLPEGLSQRITALFERVIQEEARSAEAEVGVSWVDDARMKELNLAYRGLDRSTDVLSFAMEEAVDGEPSVHAAQTTLLGDIVINVHLAKEQAEEYGHSELREFCYLALHGLLHLLGYDHEREEDRRRMRVREDELLAVFDLDRSS